MSLKQVINILFIGEIGIGKSTLINSIQTYLSFDNLKQASEAPLKPLIPVHFNYEIQEVVANSDNSEDDNDADGGDREETEMKKYEIKIGESDYEITEYGYLYSSTIWPRIYCFDYKENYRIRIIDTPGICDPDGQEQNLQTLGGIYKVVQQFSHINLIVFLLSPDQSQFTSGFTSCFKEIITKFKQNISGKNIVFVFTKSAAYDFKANRILIPLGYLAKEIKNKFKMTLLLEKNTLFAIDNVAFRYLCILANKKAKNPYTDKQMLRKSFKVSRAEIFQLFERAINVEPFKPF